MIKSVLFIFLSFLVSCGQTFNSHTGDVFLGALNYCSDTSNTRLCEANEILQTKCTNCHNSTIHSTWANYDTDAKWIASGKVIPGDPASSPVIFWLQNEGGNMPKDGPPLTDTEYQKLVDWITNL